MEKDRIILTDCDGVLCNWVEKFNEFMESKNVSINNPLVDQYKISERYGITQLDAHQLIKEFNEGPYMQELTAFADSISYVKKLANAGFRFIVVTSLSDAPQAKHYRTINLHNLFGDVFDDIICLKTGMNKLEELSRWKDLGYYWIEDNIEQAEAGYKAGLKPILINHLYNLHYSTDLFTTVSLETPWEEIYEIIKKEYNL